MCFTLTGAFSSGHIAGIQNLIIVVWHYKIISGKQIAHSKDSVAEDLRKL